MEKEDDPEKVPCKELARALDVSSQIGTIGSLGDLYDVVADVALGWKP